MNRSRRELLTKDLPCAGAAGVMLMSPTVQALAQTASKPVEVDKDVVIVMDMSGSVDEREAREMHRVWKDAIIKHFEDASNKGQRFAFNVVFFDRWGVKETGTFFVNSLRTAKAFTNAVLWDDDKDDFIPLKSFGVRGPTRIFNSLRFVGNILRDRSYSARFTDVAFMVDGWQFPYHGQTSSKPVAERSNDANIVAARKYLEQQFGASVHAMAVGRLEGTISRRTGKVMGWGETYGPNQEASIRNLLVTPAGGMRTVTEEVDGKSYSSPEAIRPGYYARSIDFTNVGDPNNPTKTLIQHVGLILGLGRN